MKLEIDHLSVPREGEIENGDAIVTRFEHNRALLAVIDALGHGPEAAAVSRLAREVLGSIALDTTVASVMQTLDTRLHGSRGAAVLLCLFGEGTLEACSVGNVELRSVAAKLPLVPTPGIVGSGFRKLKVYSGTTPASERFVAYTDGISARFDVTDFGPPGSTTLPRSVVCVTLMERLRRAHDDATVLVADLENS